MTPRPDDAARVLARSGGGAVPAASSILAITSSVSFGTSSSAAACSAIRSGLDVPAQGCAALLEVAAGGCKTGGCALRLAEDADGDGVPDDPVDGDDGGGGGGILPGFSAALGIISMLGAAAAMAGRRKD